MSADGIIDISTPVTLAHPHLVTPQAVKDKKGNALGEPKFSADLVVDPAHPQFEEIKEVAVKLASEKWPGRSFLAPSEPGYRPIEWPFKNGTTLADERKAVCEKAGKPADAEYMRGKMVIKARSKFAPGLALLKNGVTDISDAERATMAEKLFFFGAQVLARIELNAYESGSNHGVNAYLVGLGGAGEGKRLSGAGRAMSSVAAFQGYQGRVTTENPYQAPATSALPI